MKWKQSSANQKQSVCWSDMDLGILAHFSAMKWIGSSTNQKLFRADTDTDLGVRQSHLNSQLAKVCLCICICFCICIYTYIWVQLIRQWHGSRGAPQRQPPQFPIGQIMGTQSQTSALRDIVRLFRTHFHTLSSKQILPDDPQWNDLQNWDNDSQIFRSPFFSFFLQRMKSNLLVAL